MTYKSKSLVQAIDYNTIIGTGTTTSSSTATINVVTYSDINYGTDNLQTVDILVPSTWDITTNIGTPPKGVVLWIHGGGWIIGDKSQELGVTVSNVQLEYLVKANYIVVNANYRLAASTSQDPTPTGFFPNNVTDIQQIVNFLLSDGAGYTNAPNIGASRNMWRYTRAAAKSFGLMVAGGSAGGHLAIMGVMQNALNNGGIFPTSVLSIVGPMNLVTAGASDAQNPAGTAAVGLINTYMNGGNPASASPYYQLSNWLANSTLVNTNCKFYFWYNDADTLVPNTSIVPFATNLQAGLANAANVTLIEVNVDSSGNTGGAVTRPAGSDGYPTIYAASHNIPGLGPYSIPSTLINIATQAFPTTYTPTVLPNSINAVWGTGVGPSGYGQAQLTPIADPTLSHTITTISAKDWENVIAVTNLIANQQGTTIPSITPPVIGSKITTDANLIAALHSIYTNRNNSVQQGTPLTNTKTSADTWNNIIVFQNDLTFTDPDRTRYFFNLGGQIELQFSATDGASTSIDHIFNQLASSCGSLYISGVSTGTENINGVVYTGVTVVGGIPPTTSSGNILFTTGGYYGLTTAYTEIFRRTVGGSGSGAGSYISVLAKTNGTHGNNGDNGTVINIQTWFVQVPSGIHNVSAGTTVTCTVIPPYLNPNSYPDITKLPAHYSQSASVYKFSQSWDVPSNSSTYTINNKTLVAATLGAITFTPTTQVSGKQFSISVDASNGYGLTWAMTIVGAASATNLSYSGAISTASTYTIKKDVLAPSKPDTLVVTVTIGTGPSAVVQTANYTVTAPVYTNTVTMPTNNSINTGDTLTIVFAGSPNDTITATGLYPPDPQDDPTQAYIVPSIPQIFKLDATGAYTYTHSNYASLVPVSPFKFTFVFGNDSKTIISKTLTITQSGSKPVKTYNLYAQDPQGNPSSGVKPGDSIYFILKTTNVPYQTQVPFTIGGISAPADGSIALAASDFSNINLNGKDESIVTISGTQNFIVDSNGTAVIIFTTSKNITINKSITITLTPSVPNGIGHVVANSLTLAKGIPAAIHFSALSYSFDWAVSGTNQLAKPVTSIDLPPDWAPAANFAPLTDINSLPITFTLVGFIGATVVTFGVAVVDPLTAAIVGKTKSSVIDPGVGTATVVISASDLPTTPNIGSNKAAIYFLSATVDNTISPGTDGPGGGGKYPWQYYGKMSIGPNANIIPVWYVNGPYSTVNNTPFEMFPATPNNIGTYALPQATVGTPYSPQLIYVQNGEFDLGYAFNASGTLPPGLSITTNPASSDPVTGYKQKQITLSGTPTTAGTYTGSVSCVNGNNTLTQSYSIVVAAHVQVGFDSNYVDGKQNSNIGFNFIVSGGLSGDTITISGYSTPNNGPDLTYQRPYGPFTYTLDNNGALTLPLNGAPNTDGTNSGALDPGKYYSTISFKNSGSPVNINFRIEGTSQVIATKPKTTTPVTQTATLVNHDGSGYNSGGEYTSVPVDIKLVGNPGDVVLPSLVGGGTIPTYQVTLGSTGKYTYSALTMPAGTFQIQFQFTTTDGVVTTIPLDPATVTFTTPPNTVTETVALSPNQTSYVQGGPVFVISISNATPHDYVTITCNYASFFTDLNIYDASANPTGTVPNPFTVDANGNFTSDPLQGISINDNYTVTFTFLATGHSKSVSFSIKAQSQTVIYNDTASLTGYQYTGTGTTAATTNSTTTVTKAYNMSIILTGAPGDVSMASVYTPLTGSPVTTASRVIATIPTQVGTPTSAGGTVTYQPTGYQVGTYTFTFTFSDGTVVNNFNGAGSDLSNGIQIIADPITAAPVLTVTPSGPYKQTDAITVTMSGATPSRQYYLSGKNGIIAQGQSNGQGVVTFLSNFDPQSIIHISDLGDNPGDHDTLTTSSSYNPPLPVASINITLASTPTTYNNVVNLNNFTQTNNDPLQYSTTDSTVLLSSTFSGAPGDVYLSGVIAGKQQTVGTLFVTIPPGDPPTGGTITSQPQAFAAGLYNPIWTFSDGTTVKNFSNDPYTNGVKINTVSVVIPPGVPTLILDTYGPFVSTDSFVASMTGGTEGATYTLTSINNPNLTTALVQSSKGAFGVVLISNLNDPLTSAFTDTLVATGSDGLTTNSINIQIAATTPTPTPTPTPVTYTNMVQFQDQNSNYNYAPWYGTIPINMALSIKFNGTPVTGPIIGNVYSGGPGNWVLTQYTNLNFGNLDPNGFLQWDYAAGISDIGSFKLSVTFSIGSPATIDLYFTTVDPNSFNSDTNSG